MKRLMMCAALVLAACGGGEEEAGGSPALEGGPASGGGSVSATEVAQACTESSNLAPEICACIGERAVVDLEADQLAFLVASLSADTATAEAMTDELGPIGASRVAGFLTSAPLTCAAEVGP